MKKTYVILFLLLTNILCAQLPYTWTIGVNPMWISVGSLGWQSVCSVVTTNCTGNYPNNLNTTYTSPTIDAFCSVGTVDITFSASGNAEYGYDFLFIEYSLDNGVTWINPYGVSVGWTGNFGAGATIPAITVPSSTTFKFRFNFQSDGTVRSTGYKITDFDIICNNPLPIELISFGCSSQINSISLDWTTATETNNDFFSVMRSSDAINYTKIGEVVGNGTTTMMHTYSYIDYFPLLGENYYYLSQVDYNGQQTIYSVTECDNNVSVESYEIVFYNLLGQVVDINNINSGIYIKTTSKGNNRKQEKYYKN